MTFFVKYTAKVMFTIVPQGAFTAQARKTNRLTFGGGIVAANIELSLHHSLGLSGEPCYPEASWQEDVCKLHLINQRIMKAFNCTVPWLLNFGRKEDICSRICSPEE